MSNKRRKEKKKEREKQRKAPAAPTRPQLNWQDLLRIFPGLMLRALIVVMPLTILMTWLGSSKVTLFNNFWLQMGVYAAAYILFNNFIFGPIRNYKPTPKPAAKEATSSKAQK